MTEESRREWLAVAWETLKHLPADLLACGAAEARRTADHPSKIVPAINAYAQERFESRKRISRDYLTALPAPEREEPNYCTPEEADQILRQYGLKPNPVAFCEIDKEAQATLRARFPGVPRSAGARTTEAGEPTSIEGAYDH